MLDKPEKTRELVDVLTAALPFEVELPPSWRGLLALAGQPRTRRVRVGQCCRDDFRRSPNVATVDRAPARNRHSPKAAERLASRIGGVLLFALATYVVLAAGWNLWDRPGQEFSLA
jgi:hypothetical protein